MNASTKVKSEKGSMAVYVSIVLLSMILVLTAIFLISNSVRKNQINTVIKVKETYEADNDKADKLYGEVVDKLKDKVAPTATITVASTATLTNEAVTVNISQRDNKDKLDLSKCKYIYNTISGYIGTNEADYTGGTLSNENCSLTLKSSTSGIYYLHVLSKDTDGNASETISAPISVISKETIKYETANSDSNPYYTFIAPADGTYKLQVWGAQGGYRSSESYAGKGGYSIGTITLEKSTKLYVYVGGKGGNTTTNANKVVVGGYNGGGYRFGFKGGGGATDIRLTSGNWNNSSSLLSRLIVAGGGGSDGATNKKGMYGGGTVGGSSTENYSGINNYGGKGGTQEYSGYSSTYTIQAQATTGLNANNKNYYCGGFGFGGGGVKLSSGYGGAGGRRLVWRFWKCPRWFRR